MPQEWVGQFRALLLPIGSDAVKRVPGGVSNASNVQKDKVFCLLLQLERALSEG